MSVDIKLVEQLNHVVHFHGKGQLIQKMNGFEVYFKDDTYQYCWKVYENGCMIHSKSEIDVFLTCRENHQTKGHIDSEYGRIDLLCHTLKYELTENKVEVKYDLIQGQDRQAFHFILYIKEDMTHVH